MYFTAVQKKLLQQTELLNQRTQLVVHVPLFAGKLLSFLQVRLNNYSIHCGKWVVPAFLTLSIQSYSAGEILVKVCFVGEPLILKLLEQAHISGVYPQQKTNLFSVIQHSTVLFGPFL